MRLCIIAASVSLLVSASGAAKAPAPKVPPTNKVAHIFGPITAASEAEFEMQMILTAGIPGDRVIEIDSPGGEVEAGNRMLHLLEKEQEAGVKLTCVVLHQASSMAFNILTHCDARLAMPRAKMLVHKVAAGNVFLGERMTAHRMREIAHDLDEADAPFRRDNAIAMHLSLRDYDLFADNETVWSANTLLKMHYLNGIISQ